MTLRVALIAGPMYDALYARLPAFTQETGIAVDVAFSADHPALNAHLEALPTADYDLVSTHTKYRALAAALSCAARWTAGCR